MNDTTPQPQGAVALQPRRAGELPRAALGHYQRRSWTLIALVAVWVFPMGAAERATRDAHVLDRQVG